MFGGTGKEREALRKAREYLNVILTHLEAQRAERQKDEPDGQLLQHLAEVLYRRSTHPHHQLHVLSFSLSVSSLSPQGCIGLELIYLCCS